MQEQERGAVVVVVMVVVWEGLGGWCHNAINRTLSRIQGKRPVRAAQWVNLSSKRGPRVLPYPSCSDLESLDTQRSSPK